MFSFDEPLLKLQLDRLPPQARVAFAASCTQRLRSACHVFAADLGRPQTADHFDDVLGYVWAHILVKPDISTLERLFAEVMESIPDEDAPQWMQTTPYGDDALSALAYTLTCLKSGDSQDAAWTARRLYDALDCDVVREPNKRRN